VSLAGAANSAVQELQNMTKVFVSYCHAQGPWVWDRLVPVLKGSGAEVLIDRERFEAGKAIIGQMDAVQDQAERQLLVLSPEYLASKPCGHEMKRAIALDPDFSRGCWSRNKAANGRCGSRSCSAGCGSVRSNAHEITSP
jgi:hypothetical protein